ncbi:MAG: choice-of-anchor B family protein [Fimbriimonadaceae bacterium]|nr:choice-of-anchor B family protein [Fimbriimonadaceae bacterium]QYK56013.1 MAG: choice-of-anchor B family protein [Fimbriimonadaceae bacterium]
MRRIVMGGAVFGLACLSTLALAGPEYAAQGVKLLKNFPPSDFGAASGNTCWGYVSPSGREYGLMGFDNKTLVVEVTDPNDIKVVGEVPHTKGLWSDIKTYKSAAYVSTENAASGLQVIDLSKVDEGEVRLVRTIPSPGRSHTIAVDEVSGFLYTCGSREGTGTTTCFDLKADPLNPTQVGAKTMTPVYQHEAQVVTYTEGPYKGKQVFFGGGEGRGLEIFDVTDKDNPSLIRRVAYPFVGYCHQGWLSSDRKYYYVNDEFDETTNSIATRTLVFDVSVLENAELVSTYTTGKPSIDHNLYTRNDFVYHANYTTGLWIFNANDNRTSPQMVGYFDTHPENDDAVFEGAWSNYPLLPSGIVLISDINRGLFVVDVTDATKVKMPVTSAKAVKGEASREDLEGLSSVDTQAVTVKGKDIQIEFEGKSRWSGLAKVGFGFESDQKDATVELWDYKEGKWVGAKADDGATFRPEGRGTAQFLNGEKMMKARVTLKPSGGKASVNHASFVVNP